MVRFYFDHASANMILNAKRLCNVKFTSVKAQLNLSDVTINTKNGEFNPTSLAHVVNTDVVNRLVVQGWLDRACQ